MRELVSTKTLYILDKQSIYDNYSLYRFQLCIVEVSNTDGKESEGRPRTERHLSPQCSLMGPSMPNETPLNHQKQARMVKTLTPKTTRLVRGESRRAVKTKWSRRCASMRTEKYSVGS